MRAVVQRVSRAKVTSGQELLGAIGPGLVVFLGIHGNDGPDEIQWMADKILGLRIFEDEDGKMNRSLLDIGREILIVSQFTLYGDCRKGRRPGFAGAAAGRFQAFMAVELVNDGPVTLLVDSDKLF